MIADVIEIMYRLMLSMFAGFLITYVIIRISDKNKKDKKIKGLGEAPTLLMEGENIMEKVGNNGNCEKTYIDSIVTTDLSTAMVTLDGLETLGYICDIRTEVKENMWKRKKYIVDFYKYGQEGKMNEV